MIPPRIAVLLIVSIFSASSSFALNETHFGLYKNTHFGPCPTEAPPNATVPIPDVGAGTHLITNGSLSAAEFCDRFWNYTVLPSLPADGAFTLSWVNVFFNVVTWALGAAGLWLRFSPNDQDHFEEYEFSAVERTDDFDPIFIRPQKTARTTFSAIKLYGLLSYSLVTTILWWHSFIILIRDQAGSHALLSPVAVLTVIGYLVTLERDMPARLYTPLSWVLTPAALGQFGASIAALVFFYRAHAHSPQYTVLPSFDVSDYRCDVRAMLFDPTNTTYLVSLGASPILLAFALLPLALILFTCHESNLRGLGIGLAYIYIILTLFSVISFAIVGQRETNPIAWDPDCALVHVMMGSGYGYLDVQASQDIQAGLHKVKTIFGIIW